MKNTPNQSGGEPEPERNRKVRRLGAARAVLPNKRALENWNTLRTYVGGRLAHYGVTNEVIMPSLHTQYLELQPPLSLKSLRDHNPNITSMDYAKHFLHEQLIEAGLQPFRALTGLRGTGAVIRAKKPADRDYVVATAYLTLDNEQLLAEQATLRQALNVPEGEWGPPALRFAAFPEAPDVQAEIEHGLGELASYVAVDLGELRLGNRFAFTSRP